MKRNATVMPQESGSHVQHKAIMTSETGRPHVHSKPPLNSLGIAVKFTISQLWYQIQGFWSSLVPCRIRVHGVQKASNKNPRAASAGVPSLFEPMGYL